MKIHLLSGFLGAGKTSAIYQACRSLLAAGTPVGVITNDQGVKLIDGHFFKRLGIPERQVGNGCFCCNYNDLDKGITELIDFSQTEVIFAESVGTCTDIVATVLKPLTKYRDVDTVTLTTVVDVRLLNMLIEDDSIFDRDVTYIFFKQLEEAGIILINKTDLEGGDAVAAATRFVSEKYPGKKIILQNSVDENGGSEWLNLISAGEGTANLLSIDVDYDQYASGEAKMGYLDQQLLVTSETGDAEAVALAVVATFVSLVRQSGYTIGHIKFWLADRFKISFTSTTTTDTAKLITEEALTSTLVVNARVEMDPGGLNELMKRAVTTIEPDTGATVSIVSSSYFKPGYPRPTHRIAN